MFLINSSSPSSSPWMLAAVALVWCSAALVVYVWAGYPLLLALLSAAARRPRAEAGYYPFLTVLIAARNEALSIAGKLQQTLALDYPADKLEILVVSDASSDGTDGIVESFSDPRIRCLRIDPRRGKTHAQNEGIQHCRGEVIVFSDATTIYHKDSLKYLASHYRNPKVGAVSGRYRYFDPEGNSPTGLGSVAFWNFENLIKRFQSRIATLTGCSGCIYSVRKSLYTPLPDDACSDLVEPLCVVRQGYRVAFEERALAYEETTKTTTQEFTMRVRVVTRGIRGVLSVPELLKPWKRPWISFQLFSHKLGRWLAPVCIVLFFLGTAILSGVLLYRALFALQVLFYGIALLSRRLPRHGAWKIVGLPHYFCIMNLAALAALREMLKGNRFAVWETVRSAPVTPAR